MRKDKIITLTAFLGLFSAGILAIFLSLPLSVADDLTTQVTITNAMPELSAITCIPTTLTPPAGGNTTVNCTVTISDSNGFGDVNQTTLDANFFNDTFASADDFNTHYSNGTSSDAATNCLWFGGSGTSISVSCLFPTRFYIDSANWTINFTVNDTSGNRNSSVARYQVLTAIG